MATARDSAHYTNRYTTQYPVPAGEAGSYPFRIPFEATIVSAAATGDTYKLCKVPAGATIVGGFAVTDGLSASAGAGLTASVGDASSATRLIAAFDADATAGTAHLAVAGMNYQYTTETDILLTITGTPVVGKKVTGYLDYVMF